MDETAKHLSESELAEQVKEIDNLNTQNADLRVRLSEQAKVIDKLTIRSDSLRERLAEQVKLIDNLNAQVGAMAEVIDNLNAQITTMTDEAQAGLERQWMLGKLAAYERIIEAGIEAARAPEGRAIRITPNFHTGVR